MLAELFGAWWKHHGNDRLKVKDLNQAIKDLLDPTGNRQLLAAKVRRLNGTRAVGFLLTHFPADGKWAGDSYQLKRTSDSDPRTGIEGIGVIEPGGLPSTRELPTDQKIRRYGSIADWEKDL